MKTLDHSVFSLPGCPSWTKSAAVDHDGKGYWMDISAQRFLEISSALGVCVGDDGEKFLLIGEGYDATDFPNIAIDRE